MVHHAVHHGAWCMVHGVWCMVHGHARCIVMSGEKEEEVDEAL